MRADQVRAWGLAFTDPNADMDKSGSISAQEAFDFAARRVEDFFKRETRIATGFGLTFILPAGSSLPI